jgi:hypothetical protein
MNRTSHRAGRVAAIAIVVLGFAVALSCGGNDEPESPVNTGGLQAVFTADAEPTTSSVTLQSDSQSGATFAVDVTVTGIDDFYGATFKLLLDIGTVDFTDIDAGASLLVDDTVTEDDLQIIVGLLADGSGWDVTISRNDYTLNGVEMADDDQGSLAIFNFTARRATSGTAIEIVDLLVTTCPAGSACDWLEDPAVTSSGGELVAN